MPAPRRPRRRAGRQRSSEPVQPAERVEVRARSDTGHEGQANGSSSLQATFYAAAGAGLESATVNGEPVAASGDAERGHPTFNFPVELPRGVPVTVTLHLLEPAGGAVTTWRPQPMARPETWASTVTACP